MANGTGTRQRRRAGGDSGAALVEFAFVSVLLLTLVFGIISFGLILSFKQDMTRAAAEGARAGAVAVPSVPGQTYADAAEASAVSATQTAVKAFGGSFSGPGCLRPGMDCTNIDVGDCLEDLALPAADRRQCVTVELVYDYDTQPIYGEIPLLSAFLPNVVRSESVARINE